MSGCSHEHVWVEATCTEPKTCSECGETEGEALGHTWAEATCTEPKTCTVCGETDGDALGHTWIAATCTEPKTCSVCGQIEGEALGHTWNEATCTEPQTCSVCGVTEGEALGHTITEWTVSKEATCSEEGEETGICSVCGASAQRTLEKLEHTPGEWVVTKEATATSDGAEAQYCEVCGELISTRSYTLSDEEIEELYKAECDEYSYDTIARDPDEYYGTYGKYKGEVVQVLEDGDEVQLRVNITKGKYYYSDTIFVFYERKDGESRILEDDIITIYGMNMGTISYESVLGATITLPCVYAAYIDIN